LEKSSFRPEDLLLPANLPADAGDARAKLAGGIQDRAIEMKAERSTYSCRRRAITRKTIWRPGSTALRAIGMLAAIQLTDAVVAERRRVVAT